MSCTGKLSILTLTLFPDFIRLLHFSKASAGVNEAMLETVIPDDWKGVQTGVGAVMVSSGVEVLSNLAGEYSKLPEAVETMEILDPLLCWKLGSLL